ncbi:MAG: hypothetical protein RJA07_1389 [Bacteroidota bacterium]|jgi:ELWxxDGT repeat protein
MKKNYLVVVFLLLISLTAKSQLPVLLKDINSGWNSQSINFIGLPNGKTVFQANNGINGAELWITDGTTANTYLLKDINPNAGSSDPSDFIVYNNMVYFSADDGIHGKEFWVTDGTAAGTFMVKDICPGVSGSNSKYFTIFKNKLYFNAWDGFHGFELWVSDGTSLGTQLLIDINQISNPISGSNPRLFIEYNNKLYFQANDGVHGEELWVTDSSSLGTQMVKDICPGKAGSFITPQLVYKNKLYSNAWDSLHGSEMWVSDGTDTGTQILKDICPGLFGSGAGGNLIEYNNKLFFSARDTIHGFELWVSDGTDTGTQMLKNIYLDITSPPFGDNSYPSNFIVFNNKLIFVAEDAVNGIEPWVTDGTTIGTSLLVNLAPFNFSSIDIVNFYGFTMFNKKLYFIAANTTFPDYELWSTDGTVAGTCIVMPIKADKINALTNNSNNRLLTVCNGALYFRGYYTYSEGDEPYVITIDSTNTATFVEKTNNPLSISPNPCSTWLKVNGAVIGQSAIIYDVLGKEVLSVKINEGLFVDVSTLIDGIYIVVIGNNHFKLIKEGDLRK